MCKNSQVKFLNCAELFWRKFKADRCIFKLSAIFKIWITPSYILGWQRLKCRKPGLSGSWAVKYRDEKTNSSGTGPVPDLADPA